MKKFSAVLLSVAFLTACTGTASISGSTVKSVKTVARPDAVHVGAGANSASAATETTSAERAPVAHRVSTLPSTSVARPAIRPGPAAPDGETTSLSCQGFGGPGKIKLMCAPQ